MNLTKLFSTTVASTLAWLAPSRLLAHETTPHSFALPHPEFYEAFSAHFRELLLWWSLSLLIVISVLFISITRWLEELLDPLLLRIKKYAPFFMQITLGADLLYSAANNAFLGSELSLSGLFGPAAFFIQILLAVLGALLLTGLIPRMTSFLVLLVFIVPLAKEGLYMLSYATQFAEAMALLTLGGTYQLAQSNFSTLPELRRSLELHLHKYKFLLLRIAFGTSIIYSAIHSSFFHAEAALETARQTNLLSFLTFEPALAVLLVMGLQIVLGLFYIVGFEVRFASAVYLVTLLCLVLFFAGTLWPNVILLGTAIAMLIHGYDRYSVGGRLLKRGNLEPIL